MNWDECPTKYLLYSVKIAVAMMGEGFVAIQGWHALFHTKQEEHCCSA